MAAVNLLLNVGLAVALIGAIAWGLRRHRAAVRRAQELEGAYASNARLTKDLAEAHRRLRVASATLERTPMTKKPMEVYRDALLRAVDASHANSSSGWSTTVDIQGAYRRETGDLVYRELLTKNLRALAHEGVVEHQRFGRQNQWRPAEVTA